jgi:hypothetical protein
MILYPGIFWPSMMALRTSPGMLLTVAAVALGCGLVAGCLALRWKGWVPPITSWRLPTSGPRKNRWSHNYTGRGGSKRRWPM